MQTMPLKGWLTNVLSGGAAARPGGDGEFTKASHSTGNGSNDSPLVVDWPTQREAGPKAARPRGTPPTSIVTDGRGKKHKDGEKYMQGVPGEIRLAANSAEQLRRSSSSGGSLAAAAAAASADADPRRRRFNSEPDMFDYMDNEVNVDRVHMERQQQQQLQQQQQAQTHKGSRARGSTSSKKKKGLPHSKSEPDMLDVVASLELGEKQQQPQQLQQQQQPPKQQKSRKGTGSVRQLWTAAAAGKDKLQGGRPGPARQRSLDHILAAHGHHDAARQKINDKSSAKSLPEDLSDFLLHEPPQPPEMDPRIDRRRRSSRSIHGHSSGKSMGMSFYSSKLQQRSDELKKEATQRRRGSGHETLDDVLSGHPAEKNNRMSGARSVDALDDILAYDPAHEDGVSMGKKSSGSRAGRRAEERNREAFGEVFMDGTRGNSHREIRVATKTGAKPRRKERGGGLSLSQNATNLDAILSGAGQGNPKKEESAGDCRSLPDDLDAYLTEEAPQRPQPPMGGMKIRSKLQRRKEEQEKLNASVASSLGGTESAGSHGTGSRSGNSIDRILSKLDTGTGMGSGNNDASGWKSVADTIDNILEHEPVYRRGEARRGAPPGQPREGTGASAEEEEEDNPFLRVAQLYEEDKRGEKKASTAIRTNVTELLAHEQWRQQTQPQHVRPQGNGTASSSNSVQQLWSSASRSQPMSQGGQQTKRRASRRGSESSRSSHRSRGEPQPTPVDALRNQPRGGKGKGVDDKQPLEEVLAAHGREDRASTTKKESGSGARSLPDDLEGYLAEDYRPRERPPSSTNGGTSAAAPPPSRHRKERRSSYKSLPDNSDVLDEDPQPQQRKERSQKASSSRRRSSSTSGVDHFGIPSSVTASTSRPAAKGSSENGELTRQEPRSSSRRNSRTLPTDVNKSQRQDKQTADGSRDTKNRQRSSLASSCHSDPHIHTSDIRTKTLEDELLHDWPTEGGAGGYPSSIISEHALDVSNRSDKKGGGMVSSASAPDLLELVNEEEEPPQMDRLKPRRHSSGIGAQQMLGGTRQRVGSILRRKNSKAAPNDTGRRQSRLQEDRKARPKRNVTFSDVHSTHTYESQTSTMPVSKLFYSRDDDTTFSDLTVTHARSIRSYIKTSITRDETFNALTGLPSPEALRRLLLSPEDIVGIEHLLCGRGVARASLNMKTNHAKVLLDAQQRGDIDVDRLSKELRQYSNISQKLAACRASYAAMC